MGQVVAGFSMSLDGFIADAEDGVHALFRWLFKGDTAFPILGQVFMTSPTSSAHYRELLDATGAHVTGRRDFDVSCAWGGVNIMGVPMFIVTHTAPQEWLKEESPFTFITDGVDSAIEQARKAAGDKNVLVTGSQIVQQGFKAGLIDEIQIDLVPILLGSGIRLFDHLGPDPIELDAAQVIAAPGVTHLRFRVVK